jgi:hypothetical protein
LTPRYFHCPRYWPAASHVPEARRRASREQGPQLQFPGLLDLGGDSRWDHRGAVRGGCIDESLHPSSQRERGVHGADLRQASSEDHLLIVHAGKGGIAGLPVRSTTAVQTGMAVLTVTGANAFIIRSSLMSNVTVCLAGKFADTVGACCLLDLMGRRNFLPLVLKDIFGLFFNFPYRYRGTIECD